MNEITKQQVNEELKSIGKAPYFQGTDFDNEVLNQIFNEPAEWIKLLQAFELGRRSTIRKNRVVVPKKNKIESLANEQDSLNKSSSFLEVEPKAVKDLSEFTSNMDYEISSAMSRVETISNVKTELFQLKQEMDIQVHRNKQNTYFPEFHRKIQVLTELLLYSADDLEKHIDNVSKIHHSMFYEIMGLDKKKPFPHSNEEKAKKNQLNYSISN